MRKVKCKIGWAALVSLIAFVACERDFDIKIKNNEPQLVVEAYINNLLPTFNYVVLSKSKNYYEPGFQNTPVGGAKVYITEGELSADNKYRWDETSTRELREVALPQVRNSPASGVYFDPRLVTDSANALRGKPGKHYLLEIEVEGKKYTATTALLIPVPVDSLSTGNYFVDEDDDHDTLTKARITVYFKDPDTIGNTQLYYWRHGGIRNNFGWGGLGANWYTPGTDELVNGQNVKITHSYGFVIGDTVEYFMANVERKVYNFWDSFNKARDNGGPFATPVSLLSTINGENVTGCFSGFSLSTRNIIVK
jgi:hypothetical protein